MMAAKINNDGVVRFFRQNPMVLFAAGLLLACAITWRLTPTHHWLSYLTPTTSLLMVVLLNTRYSDWPKYCLVAGATLFISAIILAYPMTVAVVECPVVLVQAICGAWFGRALMPRDESLTLSNWLKTFAVLLLLINPLAALAAAGLHFTADLHDWHQLWKEWLLRDTISANVFFTYFLFFRRRDISHLAGARQARDALLGFLLLAGYSFVSIENFTNPFIALALPFTLIALYFSMLQTGLMTWSALACVWGLHLGGWSQPAAEIFRESEPTAALLLSVCFVFPAIVGIAMQEARAREEKILGLSERLNLATTSNGLGVWEWDLVHHKLIWDRQMHHLYGATELQNREMPINWREHVVPGDLPKLDQALDTALTGERVAGVDFAIRTTQGKERILRMTATPIKNDRGQVVKLVGINSDITDTYYAELLIAEKNRIVELTQKEFALLFEMAPGPLLLVNTHGKIKKANSSAHQLFGYSVLAEVSINRIFPENPLHELLDQNAKNSAQAASEYRAELLAITREQEAVAVELKQRIIHLNGETYAIVSVRDLTEQKQVEAAISSAQREAERANVAKSEFIANMSHEIRTPLNATLGTVKLLQHTHLTELQLSYLNIIRSSGESLLGILNDILDISKIEAGRMELSPVPFNLEDVLTRTSSIMAINSGDKDLDLIIHLERDVGTLFYGDPLRLQQVLVNLVSNAIKFTDRGFIRLRVRQINADAEQSALEFAVQDTGIGIAPEKQQRLFTAFSQADNSITRRFGGSGLGLVISKRLVEMMGGSIRLHSKENEGSEFIFTVTLQRAPEEIPAPAQQRGAVLLVEPQDELAEALVEHLVSWSWHCQRLRSIEQAMEQLDNASDHAFDFVILSATFAAEHGLALQKKLLALGLRTTTAVVVLGRNRNRERLNDQLRQRLLDGVLIQPVTRTQLSSVLNEAAARVHGVDLSTQSAELDKTPYLQGLNILLVEDNALNQVVARGLLEQYGAQVDIAADGQQAVDRLAQGAERYQVILMDVQMPVMDGFTATRIIRDELRLTIPILAMSAGVMASEKSRCLLAGMVDFVAKPIQVEDLLNAILAAVKRPCIGDRFAQSTIPPGTEHSIFNPENLLRHIKGNAQRYSAIVQMIRNVVERGHAPLDDALAELQQHNWEEARRIFHTIKGSMGNIGAMRVWHAAQGLEMATTDRSTVASLQPLLNELRQTFDELFPVVRHWLQNQPTGLQENTLQINTENLRGHVGQLYDLLTQNDMQALDIYEVIRLSLNNQLGPDDSRQLDQAIQNLRFAEAGRFLREKFAV